MDKGLTLDASLDLDLSGSWSGDAHKLDRVLVNLVGKAIKFTEQSGVSLRVGRDRSNGERERVVFRVQDTRVGIAADQVSSLFAPCHQGDNPLSRRHGGSGLAIVRGLVNLMGGEVSVEGRPEAGTASGQCPASMALSIHAVFSWTCMRWVSRSAVGSS